MAEINIKINIAGRIYPLSINDSEEEELRATVKKIKEDIEQIELEYAVKDKQDIVAMLLLQYGNTIMKQKKYKMISENAAYLSQKTLEILDQHI